MKKLQYLKRIISAYILRKDSQLTFWHNTPKINDNAFKDLYSLDEYYMCFYEKAKYNILDDDNIPILDYHGNIGKQYNPIAIAQYGLGNCNLYFQTKDKKYLDIINNVGSWFIKNIFKLKYTYVWLHNFDFEYTQTLQAPWYSGLAQGQILSFLLRAYVITNNILYLDLSKKAFISLTKNLDKDGVMYKDNKNNLWLEEYITSPPTHILNGFIWGLWGIYDYWLFIKDNQAKDIFNKCVKTIVDNLQFYDNGFWSLYDLSNFKLKNIASFFYHKLHIVQLLIMYKITNNNEFLKYHDKWKKYSKNKFNRYLALIYKSIFKIIYF